MNLQIQQCGAVSVARLAGPLTRAEADEFKSQMLDLIKKNLGRVVVDASAIPYVDSPGLESLVDLTRQLALSGMALKLCAANETLRQVIELTGLCSQFEQFEDTNAAIRSFL